MPTTPEPAVEVSAEDLKLATLARAARARAGGGAAAQGAAVRDDIGRTYAAAAVSLPSMALTALQAAVAAAVSSGSGSLEAAVVLGGDGLADADRSVVADLGIGTVWLAAVDGSVTGRG